MLLNFAAKVWFIFDPTKHSLLFNYGCFVLSKLSTDVALQDPNCQDSFQNTSISVGPILVVWNFSRRSEFKSMTTHTEAPEVVAGTLRAVLSRMFTINILQWKREWDALSTYHISAGRLLVKVSGMSSGRFHTNNLTAGHTVTILLPK